MILASTLLAALTWPTLFWWGTGAVSVPIIIHLLAKRRYKRVRWAAMEFLLQAEKENRRKINIRELILLLMRCLAIFLLGLLLARPFLSPNQLGAALGVQQPTSHVVVLDDSFSMAYSSGGRTQIDHAADAAVRLVDSLRTRAEGDRLTLVKISDPQTPLVEGAVLAEVAREDLRQQLGNLTASSLAARFGDYLVQLQSDAVAAQDAGPMALYIIGDFQRGDWLGQVGAADADRKSPLSILEDWPQERVPLDVTLVQVAPASRPNTAVVALKSDQAQVVGGVENNFRATIANFSGQTSTTQNLQVFFNDAAQETVEVPALQSGETADVAFTLIPPVRGSQALRVEVGADALAIDNQRSLALDVMPALEVLLVNGEPGVSSIVDEVALLETALQPEGDVFSGIGVSTVDESDLETTRLDDIHVIVLANVYRPTEEVAARLEAFVAAGGGLAIFLGDQVDHDTYNQRLYRDGNGLLPGALGRLYITADAQLPPGIVEREAEHPMIKVLSGADNPFRQKIRFWQFYECVLQDPADAGTGSTNDGGVRVVASFEDDLRSSAILEKTVGKGRVLLMTSSCDLEWNDWPKSPSYVVAMLEMVQYLAARSREAAVVAGADVRVPARGATFNHEARWRRPGYPVVPEKTELAQPIGADFEWRITPREVGMHRLILRDSEGQESERLVAVNTDPTESDLMPCTDGQLRQASPDVPFTWITDLDALGTSLGDQHRELWPIVLLCAAVLLMAEQTLAERFGRV